MFKSALGKGFNGFIFPRRVAKRLNLGSKSRNLGQQDMTFCKGTTLKLPGLVRMWCLGADGSGM